MIGQGHENDELLAVATDGCAGSVGGDSALSIGTIKSEHLPRSLAEVDLNRSAGRAGAVI